MNLEKLRVSIDGLPGSDELLAEVDGPKVILKAGGVPICIVDIADYVEPIRHFGNLVYDTKRGTFSIGNQKIHMTEKEQKVFLVVVNSIGVVGRRDIHERLWGGHGNVHVVDVHMSSLRRKLAKYGWNRRIITVRGFGFRFE